MTDKIDPELPHELLERAHHPKVGIPIEPIDQAAADLRDIMDSFGLVPRGVVTAVAEAIVGANDDIERERRSAGGRKTAQITGAPARERRALVRQEYDKLPSDDQAHPYSAKTLRQLQERLDPLLADEPSSEALKRDFHALRIKSGRQRKSGHRR
jgi:hypothetical protein